MPIWKSNPRVGRKGEGGEEDRNPESEHLPAKAHRSPFARKGQTLIAKMKGESPDARIPCGPVWPSPERNFITIQNWVTSGVRRFLLLFVLFWLLPLLPSHAGSVLLGTGLQSNHLLILFAPGQTLQYELRHDGSIHTGEQLLAAAIQATGGLAVTTTSKDTDGNQILFSFQLSTWNGQGLFAHFYDYGRSVFINGFASGNLSAASDGSWSEYFSYQIGGASADFISAPVGASQRILGNGDHDAYVLTSTFSSPGLAAWMNTHQITDLEEDPDSDGLKNLLEYALRRHPREPDAAAAIVAGQEQLHGTSYLTLTYRRPHDEWASVPDGADAAYDGVGYTVETSTDLVIWHSGANYVTQIVTPDTTGPMATVLARVPADSSKRFLRLQVHIP
jgi:hypothetical protein